MRVGTTKDAECNYIRALVYGDSGTGKTTSLGTLPEESTLIVAAERGLLPLQGREYNAIQVDKWEDLRGVVRALANGSSDGGPLNIKIGDTEIKGIRTVAFDSLTELNELCKRHIIEVDRVSLIQERTKGEESTPRGIYADQLGMEDYGVLSRRVQKMVNTINHLPVNTIFTSLGAWKEDRISGRTRRVIALNGSLAVEIPSQFDLVLHMESNEAGDRTWRTFNDDLHLSKDASGTLADFEPCDWTKLFSKIRKLKR